MQLASICQVKDCTKNLDDECPNTKSQRVKKKKK